jgi:HK97 family phage major capsid protein
MLLTKAELEVLEKNYSVQVAERIIKEINERRDPSQFRKSSGVGPSGDNDFDQLFSIAKYLRGSMFNNWQNAEFEKSEYTKLAKALGEGTGSTGGFLVPEQYVTQIIPLLQARAIVRNAGATVYPMSTDTLTLPRQTGASGTSWGEENTSFSEDTNPTFGKNQLVLKKLKALLYVSNELIEDASPSVDALITNDLVKSLSLAEDLAFFAGTGGTQPLGLTLNPDVAGTTLGAGAGAMPSIDDFIDAMHAIDVQNGTYTGWAMNPRTLTGLRKVKDSQGNYIYWKDPQGKLPDMLFGFPIFRSTQISIAQTVGSNTNCTYIILANWPEVAIGQKGELRLETTRVGGNSWANDQTSFRAVRRVDMIPRQPLEIYVMKGVLPVS